MSGAFRYAAFVSYFSKDAAFAQRLRRALEAYAVPKSLGEFDLLGDGAGKTNRVYPVFRDREELAASHLAERIEASMEASAALVVVCSPNAAASPWVEKEIESFVAQGRADRIFAIIANTAPLFDVVGADATPSCFRTVFRADALSGGTVEPLAADACTGKDGFRNAYLKVVSGLVGVTPGQALGRERQRRGRRKLMIAGGVAAGTIRKP
jgi:hypothetical protein